MTADIDYLILEHLTAIRGDLETVKADIRDILEDLDTHIARLEVRMELTG